LETGLLVLITQRSYAGFLEAIANKNVRRTGGFIDIYISVHDSHPVEDDQVRSSQPVGRMQVTRKGRAVKPSRKAKDIVLAENEELEHSQRIGVGQKRIRSSKEARAVRTFSLEPEH
jgi:hypothetical protein